MHRLIRTLAVRVCLKVTFLHDAHMLCYHQWIEPYLPQVSDILTTILLLKFDPPFSYLLIHLKTAIYVVNSVVPDQTPRTAASDLGLHCLLRPF